MLVEVTKVPPRIEECVTIGNSRTALAIRSMLADVKRHSA
jgi:hypothetical protein